MGLLDKLLKRAPTSTPMPDLEPGQRQVRFEELGMHCAGCQTSVETVLEEEPGVYWFDVDLDRQAASVIYEPERTNPDKLGTALGEVGFPPKSSSEGTSS